MPKTYTVKEVADILGYSTNSIYTFLKEKRINGVRVGRGRFRIPEEELNRVLHLSKRPLSTSVQGSNDSGSAALAPQVSTVTPIPLIASTPTYRDDAGLLTENGVPAVSSGKYAFVPPNLFDWFVGTTAIVSGLALFVFNANYADPNFSTFTTFASAGRVLLMAAGLGVILSSMLAGSAQGWKKVFYFILGIGGSLNVYFLAQGGDVDGAILYGAMAALLFLRLVVPLGGIVSFGSYASLLALLMPIAIFLYPADSHFVSLATYLHATTEQVGAGVAAASVLFLITFWVGYALSPALFVVTTIVGALAPFAAALFFAASGFWSRAFYLMVLGFFALSLPSWRTIQAVCNRAQRTLLHTLFGVVCGMFCLAVLVVFVLQQSTWSNNKIQFFNKITSAQQLLETAVESVKSSLVIAVSNRDFVGAMEQSDAQTLTTLGKFIYESNKGVRRLVFLSANGDGIALYPYGTFDQPNFAFREYFQQARDTRAPYISNVFQALVDDAGRQVVVVAVPVFDATGEFTGVVAASLDFVQIGTQIQGVAVEEEGEYFVLYDKDGKALYHPDASLIGTEAPEDDVVRLAVAGEKDVVQSTLRDGRAAMIAYAPVPALGWAVTLRAPAIQVYALTSSAVLSVLGVIGAVVVAATIILMYFRVQWCDIREDGP